MHKKIINISLIVLVVVFLLTGIYRVNQGEEGLILTFGEITARKQPGTIGYRLPIVQKLIKKSTTNINTFEYGYRTSSDGDTDTAADYIDVPEESRMLTSDGNVVQVEAIFQFVISDPESLLFEVDDPSGTIMLAFESVLRRNIQSKTLDDALVNKSQIQSEVLADFRKKVQSYNMGLDIQSVQLQNIRVPDEVKAAYEDVNNAINEKRQMLDKAEEYKNEQIPKARAKAHKMIEDATAYKTEKIAQATGDVANFEKVYEKYAVAKDVTRKRLLIETMETVLAKAKKKYVIENSNDVLKFLPIEDSN